MKSKTILVDSNIVIYAINTSSPKHLAAQAFLQANASHLAIAHQNVLECLRVLTHKKFAKPMTPGAAIKAVGAITDFCRILAPDRTSHYVALALIQKHKLAGNNIFDAYLAATALSAGVTILATDNTKDFLAFEGLIATNPFSE